MTSLSFLKRHRVALGVFAISVLFLLASVRVVPSAWAQARQTSAPAGEGQFMDSKTANDQHLAAAEEEDETAVYKRSPAVQAIGRAFHLSPTAASSVFEYFNFALLAGIVIFYLARALPKVFRSRQDKLEKQLVEARTATEEANQRLSVVEDRLSRLDGEIEELRKRSEQEAVADEQRIKQSIEEERKKIVASAEQEIAAASLVAERNLRKFAAELAIGRAKGQLHVSEQQDRVLVREFAANLHERRN